MLVRMHDAQYAYPQPKIHIYYIYKLNIYPSSSIRRALARTAQAIVPREELLPRGELAAVAASPQRIRSLLAQAVADDLLEGEAEVLAEQRVDARVYGRVAVAQPEQHAEHRRVDASGAERAHQVHREERQPAQDEAAHDYRQRLRRLRLHSDSFHLVLTGTNRAVSRRIARAFREKLEFRAAPPVRTSSYPDNL